MPDTYTITIKRFDPSTDAESYVTEYEVPADPDFEPMTALKALHYINKNVEPIGYDFNCRRGTCGRCAIMVDGNPSLACTTALTGKHTFEPLAGFPVVRDLIVDKKKAYARFLDSSHTIKTLGPKEVLKPIDGETWRKIIYPLNACRECMCCYAGCQALQTMHKWGSYAGPGAMQAIYLRSIDGEDKSSRVEQAAFAGLFECIQCGNCTLNCPAGISAAENIKSMMDSAEEMGLKPASADGSTWWPTI